MQRWLFLALPVIVLLCSSLLILHSVSPQDFVSQCVFAVMGLISLIIFSRIDYRLYNLNALVWYLLTVLPLLATLLLGVTSRGSTRWITIFGYRLQPSEFIKPMFILFIAVYLTHTPIQKIKPTLKFLIYCLIPVGLIFKQPDLGTALILIVLIGAGLLACGVSFKTIGIFGLLLLVAIPLSIPLLKPYQLNRIHTFLNPTSDPLGKGYNSLQATIAVGSGKIFGKGLGQGTQSQLRFLPERQTDFIFASFIEELGFVGGGILLSAYAWLARGLLKTAKYATSPMGSLVSLLTLALLLVQVIVNIGMNMGIMPITGITLPLVSAGGSSLLSLLTLLGVNLNIAKQAKLQTTSLEIR